MFKNKKTWIFVLYFISLFVVSAYFWPDIAAGEKGEHTGIVANEDATGGQAPDGSTGTGEQGTSSFPSGSVVLPQPATAVACDYFLQNCLIVDGSGEKPYYGNVAIKGDTITDIGYCLPAEGAKVIDMAGRVVCPGFIDLHTHTEGYWLSPTGGDIVLRQGITTQIVGNCGTSTSNVSQFLKEVNGSAINVGTFIGYKALRRMYIKDSEGVTTAVTAKMADQLKTSIENGAFGFSVGLSYFPQNKATDSELLTLAKATKEAGGLWATHIRDEYDNVIASLAEVIKIAKESGVPLEYSHVKAAGRGNWDKQDKLLEMVEEAKADGVDIMADAYPYTYSSWDVGGKNDSLSEENVRKVLQNPLVMIISDSGLGASGIASHPRAYANATRILAYYVRDQKVLTLEEAVMKMTSMPAKRLGLDDRGLLKKGMKADIAVFYLDNIKENATRLNPNQLSDGISYLFVNGKLAIDGGKVTGVKAGVALKRENPVSD